MCGKGTTWLLRKTFCLRLQQFCGIGLMFDLSSTLDLEDEENFSLKQGCRAYHDAHLGQFRTIWDNLGIFGTI